MFGQTKISVIALACCVGIDASAQPVAPLALGTPSAFITLGTLGGPRPRPERSEPANLLITGKDHVLIDAGDGAAQQLAKVGVAPAQLRAIFISHFHFDHIGGLGGILGLRFQTKARGPLTIYGPPGMKDVVAGLIASMQPGAASGDGIPGAPRRDPAAGVEVIELVDGSTVTLGAMRVQVTQNTHYSFAPGSPEDLRSKSLSYRFNLPDRAIVYTGDTGPSPQVAKLGKGADLLVSEMIDQDATLAEIQRIGTNEAPAGTRPPTEAKLGQHLSTQHLTPEQVGIMARDMGVKQVVLTHLVIGSATDARLAKDVTEINAIYKGKVVVAHDLDRF